jgi:hypothetical protein
MQAAVIFDVPSGERGWLAQRFTTFVSELPAVIAIEWDAHGAPQPLDRHYSAISALINLDDDDQELAEWIETFAADRAKEGDRIILPDHIVWCRLQYLEAQLWRFELERLSERPADQLQITARLQLIDA